MNEIPKILHLYWDRSPMAWLQVLTIDTFIQHNPDWQIFVYLPDKPYTGSFNYIPEYTGIDFFSWIEDNPYVNIVSVDLNDYDIKDDLHDILRSDILRYHLLYNIGGVWSDFDVIWLKPMFHLSEIADTNDFTTTICLFSGYPQHHNISVLVSKPKHPFYKAVIDNCNFIQTTLGGRPEHQEYGTTMLDKMFPNVNELLSQYPGMVKLDYSVFFPYSIYKMAKLYVETDLSVINDDVMCVHWFNGHKLSKKYVNSNMVDNCSMTKIINQLKETEGYNEFNEFYF